MHSWWIPELGGKFQAVPGYHNYSWFKISKPGVYRGQCASLCGRGHARMIASVKAVPPAQFEAWLAYQKLQIARGQRRSEDRTGEAERPDRPRTGREPVDVSRKPRQPCPETPARGSRGSRRS